MNLQFFTYNVPFANSFITASSKFNTRKGIIIKLQKDGIIALGEIAPLPSFSVKNLDEVICRMQEKKLLINNFFNADFSMNEINQLINQFQQFPSIQFGLFTVAAVYLAQHKKQSLHHLLSNDTAEKVKINAVIDLKEKNVVQETEEQIKKGFDTIKIKVGFNQQRSLKRIEEVRTTFKNLKIRLDANQNWSLEEAIDFLTQVEQYQIEYCEEPLKKPSIQNLLMLKGAVSISLAVDETMACWPKIEDQAFIADIFVLKPMIAGGQSNITAIYEFARKHNKEIVFTSSLGTAAERLMTASLAATYGSKKHAHGLNTGRLLKNDIWRDTKLMSTGWYKLPDYRQLKQLMKTDMNSIQLKPI